jgi:hypothetical protein
MVAVQFIFLIATAGGMGEKGKLVCIIIITTHLQEGARAHSAFFVVPEKETIFDAGKERVRLSRVGT